MKKIILIVALTILALHSKAIEPLPQSLKEQMIQSGIYKEGCPVALNNLRLVTVAYKDFKGELQEGKIVVSSDIANEVVQIFNILVKLDYPIQKVAPLSNYGSYINAINKNITYGFDCRVDLNNPKKWSKHAFGKAIDINPVQNPYVNGSKILPANSKRYTGLGRRHIGIVADNRAILLKTDAPIDVFKKKNWKWGGDFAGYKDYAHFEKEVDEQSALPITQQKKEQNINNIKVKNLFKNMPTEDNGLF